MKTLALKLYVKAQSLMAGEEGQDLVEYALLVSLIALGALTAISSLSTSITTVFNNITTSI